VARALNLSEVWNDYMFHHSRPITSHLIQAESLIINAFNVHALTRVLDEFQPDVAYVWMIVGVGGLGLMAALQHLRVPWLWHLMDDVPLALCRLSGRPVEPLLREFDRQLDGRYLACSRQLVDEIEAGGIGLRPDVEVLPNWVVGGRPEARADYYRPGRTLRIVAAGQINRNKGADHLIEAASRLVDRGFEDFVIDFYGRTDDPYWQALVRFRGLDRHVYFRGSRPQAELARLYPAYDVFAFPTWRREPFAFAPLEAAWRECVPLMSNQCGNAEWFVHGVHCLKSERTPDAFADAFAEILSGAVDLAPIARRASAVVGREFHLDSLIPRIERALVSASGRPRVGAGTGDEAYRMAVLAEKLARVLIQEVVPAA
jgi:glycosyltransferase involved in cell wall biosynthesis